MLTRATLHCVISMFCLLVQPSPVQVIDWKDPSLKWPIMCWLGCYTLLTHCHSMKFCCFFFGGGGTGSNPHHEMWIKMIIFWLFFQWISGRCHLSKCRHLKKIMTTVPVISPDSVEYQHFHIYSMHFLTIWCWTTFGTMATYGKGKIWWSNLTRGGWNQDSKFYPAVHAVDVQLPTWHDSPAWGTRSHNFISHS